MTVLGVVFAPDLPPERLHAAATAADHAGVEELWLWEDCFRESGIACAAAVLGWTTNLRVGVGVLPMPLRNVAITAMESATLARLFPDRIIVGVGHGVQEWMGQVGVRPESPMTLFREYLSALRVLLAGDRLTVAGRYVKLDDVGLDWPPPQPPPVVAGAVGPRTLQLSGELADGTILTAGTSPEALAAARRHIDVGRNASSTSDFRGSPGSHRIIVNVHAAISDALDVTDDAIARLERERVRWGYDTIDDRCIVGDAHAFADAIARWVDAGADTVVLQPTPDDPDLEAFMSFVATQVRPLVP
jgi:alkanesulfonate monooxygenase SsuD/methylene tetrahydromethanopterin reductase-like flavin-dependent oxidoreductase (luciferase family)